jgi:hypothetical protein
MQINLKKLQTIICDKFRFANTCKAGGRDDALMAEEEALEELLLAPLLLLG